jgi:hypothetical protein
MARSTKSSRSRKPRAAAPGLTRAHVVWVGFLGSMTLVGGLLLLVQGGKPAARADGLSLSPLAAATTLGSSAADPILQTRRPLDGQRWRAIVIHHSGSSVDTPQTIARDHQALGLAGLGHHFVIGNGQKMDDGQVHIGYRWLDQLPGAHVADFTPAPGETRDARWYNEHSISICLVGDGNRRGFTPAQVQQLTNLVDSLRRRLNIPAEDVRLHSELAPVDDPGKLFPAGLYGLPAGTPRR